MQTTCCEVQIRWNKRLRQSRHLTARVHITVSICHVLLLPPWLHFSVCLQRRRFLSSIQVCSGQAVCCYKVQSNPNWCYINSEFRLLLYLITLQIHHCCNNAQLSRNTLNCIHWKFITFHSIHPDLEERMTAAFLTYTQTTYSAIHKSF